MLGFAKDLPLPEMESLLLAAMTVDGEAMQQLAVRRGVAVRDYLAAREIPGRAACSSARRRRRARRRGLGRRAPSSSSARADLKLARHLTRVAEPAIVISITCGALVGLALAALGLVALLA